MDGLVFYGGKYVLLFEITMPWVMFVIAPGFEAVPGKLELAVELSRITFPYLLFISLVSLQSGILNSLGHFAAAAATPIILNIALIFALLLFSGKISQLGHVLSFAVSLAGLAQFIWLAFHCKKHGFILKIRLPRRNQKVRVLLNRIAPVILGSSLYQVNLLIGTILASLISEGAVSYLYYADRITQLPLGVVGVAVGTALLPLLSRQLANGEQSKAFYSQNRGLELAIILTVPAAVALMAIPLPIVMVLFERGAFDHEASIATANAMSAFALGLPAYVLIKVLTPGFFAREDTSTPVQVAGVSIVINIFLNIVLMQFFGHVGIALATSISAWVNALGLALLLRRRNHLFFDKKLVTTTMKVILTSLIMGLCLYIVAPFMNVYTETSQIDNLIGLSFLILLGLIIFTSLILILRVVSFRDILAYINFKKGY